MLKSLFNLFIFVKCTALFADSPLPQPEEYKAWSPMHQFYVISKPTPEPSTSGYESGKAIPLWTVNRWFRECLISDDGDHFVTLYNGVNLIPEDYSKDLILLTFWNKEKIVTEYTVKELKSLGLELTRTQSHWVWIKSWGYVSEGFRIVDPNNNVFIFATRSGELCIRGNLMFIEE